MSFVGIVLSTGVLGKFVLLGVILLVVSCSSFGMYHKVKPGETIYSISRKYKVPARDIMSANDIVRPERLQAGEMIFIPGVSPEDAEELEREAQRTKREKHSSSANGKKKAIAHVGTHSGSSVSTTKRKPPKNKSMFIWPVKGVVTSKFGRRWGRVHNGIDIAAPKGTPIVAAADGVVMESQRNFHGYGNLIIIDHGDFVTVYAHCQKLIATKGQRVRKGQKIATVGDTGRATGSHLHFEIRYKTKPVDPLKYLP